MNYTSPSRRIKITVSREEVEELVAALEVAEEQRSVCVGDAMLKTFQELLREESW